MMKCESDLLKLVTDTYNDCYDVMDDELRFALLDTLKKIPNTDSRLLATRLSAIVSRKILSYGAAVPKELLTLSIFLQKGEATYKKRMMWSSIFGNL